MTDGKAKAEYIRARNGLIAETAAVLAALVFIFGFVFGIHIQKGDDMYPAIKDGDMILYYRTHDVMNTEAVVYKAGGEMLTGRVEATGGAVIDMTADYQMTFDGNYLPISPADGIYERTYAPDTFVSLPIIIDDDSCFILGDKRESARDSREFGPVLKKNVKGRIVTVLRRRQI